MIRRFLKKACRHFATGSKSVQVQIIFCMIHGGLDIFGVGGTFALLMKAKRLGDKQKTRSVTHGENNVLEP